MKEEDIVLEIKDPWSMPYLEDVDEILELFRAVVPKGHRLESLEVFPEARKARSSIMLFSIQSNPNEFFIVKLAERGLESQPLSSGPKVEYLHGIREVQQRIDADEDEWLRTLPRDH